jgi:thiol-disulfide isomerase/thioredoxin
MDRGMNNLTIFSLAIAATILLAGCCEPLLPKVEKPPPVVEEPALPEPDCAGEPICWFEDDYPAALEYARAMDLPLVVDIWAPWCHTCLSMKHQVLAGPGMEPLADRFVWLAIDTDKPENASALAKLPVSSWPTFYVVSPVDESIQARFVGAASLHQFREFLASGEAGHLDTLAADGALAEDDPLYLLRDGDRAAAAGEHERADELYGRAIEAAPADWPRRPDALVSRISTRYRREAWSACAELGLAEIDNTGSSASAGDFAYYAFACAGRLDQGDLMREQIHFSATARLQQLADDDRAPLAEDDRSDILRLLREVQHAMGDLDTAKATAERQRELLERAAGEADSPAAASTYNWPRAEVHVYLERGADIIPALEQSADDLPKDYDPPYRVAWVALRIGELDKALTAAERSLELVYGPRKGRVMSLIADIYKARGDKGAERAQRQAVIEHYQSLPEGQQSERAEEAAREALAAMDAEPVAEASAAATEPILSPAERARAIRKASRAFKNPPGKLDGDERIIHRGQKLDELNDLGAFEIGMKKHQVRKLLGKPDWVDKDKPRYKDTESELEWHYETSPVGGYGFGFIDSKLVYHHGYHDDPNPP